jgi:microcompartment protein CcmK/EutM
MLLGRVVGEVWATVKDEKLEGARFLVVQQLDLQLKPQGGFVVAVDSLDAGVGEVVLVAQGSSARQTKGTQNRPVDAVIMAIVENLDVRRIEDLEREYASRRREVEARLAKQPEE